MQSILPISRVLAPILIAAPLLGNECLADGQGVLVQAQGDRLVVGYDNDLPGGQSIGERVFGALFPSNGLTQDPSFLSLSSPPDGADALPTGLEVHWDFLPMTIGGATSNLMHWNGIGEPDFQPALSETLSLHDPLNVAATVDGSAAAVPGRRVGTTDTSAQSIHAHLWWWLQGDSGTPTPGIYATALRLRADGYVSSDPIFVALSTFGTPLPALNDTALPWLEANIDDLILEGDYNFDGTVDALDYELWRAQYGATTPQPVNLGEADGNGDGRVNLADYTVWRDHLTTTPAATARVIPAPEPSSATIALAMLGVFAQRLVRASKRRGCSPTGKN